MPTHGKTVTRASCYYSISWQQMGNGVINVIHGQRDNPVGNANATQTGYYMRKYIPEVIWPMRSQQA